MLSSKVTSSSWRTSPAPVRTQSALILQALQNERKTYLLAELLLDELTDLVGDLLVLVTVLGRVDVVAGHLSCLPLGGVESCSRVSDVISETENSAMRYLCPCSLPVVVGRPF